MSKIFRLSKEGSTTLEDWTATTVFPYNSTARETIDDPDGASARHEITSIPSPMARIDLVKTAFREVSTPRGQRRQARLEGDTIYHKMVSDALDVAEIFFNIDRFDGKIEIIKWAPDEMLAELRHDDTDGHLYLADALEKYLKADAAAYNFDRLEAFYLLNYITGPDELNIIGATSPATLFVPGPNRPDYIDDIYLGQERPFTFNYRPLHRRDPEFIVYLFALRKSIAGFADLFHEVDDYLAATYRAITDHDLKNRLLELDGTMPAGVEPIRVDTDRRSDNVEVLGHEIGRRVLNAAAIESDFTLAPTIDDAPGSLPLVLPVEAGNRYSAMRYTTAPWGTGHAAPFEAPSPDEPIESRTLPFDGSRRAWITVSDLLEETLVTVPHALNTAAYFDGNCRGNARSTSLLLPLKPLFFTYFSVESLRSSMPDGRPMIEMDSRPGGDTEVTLRVPVKGNGRVGYVEYRRRYRPGATPRPDQNQGSVAELRFSGFIMPQVTFENMADAIYNVTCIKSGDNAAGFTFYNAGRPVVPKSVTCRAETGEITHRACNYLIEGNHFDIIRVAGAPGSGIAGIVVPIFRRHRSLETLSFAIDLGTSNTHIEYSVGQSRPRVLTFSGDDRQLCEIFTPTLDSHGTPTDLVRETELTEKDFIPAETGQGDFRFPTRTVLSAARAANWDTLLEPYTLVNLPFTYEKRAGLDYNRFIYNIKWGGESEQRVMESYVSCLMLIMRNKVLLADGDLAATRITWFHPLSMSPKRLSRLRRVWEEARRKYFGPGLPTETMTESEAPINYYFTRYANTTSLVNIDIGGGTTDIAIARDNHVETVTSFRFAVNSLFENQLSTFDNTNGIIDRHADAIARVLEANKKGHPGIGELARVLDQLSAEGPANVASFLFSLADNTLLSRAGINPRAVNFDQILRDDEDFKIVFIIFYTAIIHHVATLVKTLGIKPPRHLSVSGNGSKILRVITDDIPLLSRYTRLVFEKVLGHPLETDLDILGLEADANPKESTCKGGIIGHDNSDAPAAAPRRVIVGHDGKRLLTPADTYDALTAADRLSVVDTVKNFFSLVLDEIPAEWDLDSTFGVSRRSLETARRVALKDLDTYLDKGLAADAAEGDTADAIAESLLFHPLKGAINAISAAILDNLNNRPS